MTKKIFKILLIFIICISSFITASAATIPPVTVLLDYNKINFDIQPRIINSRTMVPIRAIFESLDISVGWDGENQIITGTKDDIVIKMTVNQITAYVNDKPVKLDSPPTIINGRTLVPVRFIAEATGAKVTWNNTLRQVGIFFNTIPPTDGNSPWNVESGANKVLNNGLTYYAGDGIWILKDGQHYDDFIPNEGTENINIIGNYIFYISTSDNYRIHRINKNGTGEIAFNGTDFANKMYVSDGVVYYDKQNIYKINIDGTGKKKLNDLKSISINVTDNYIYYVGSDTNHTAMYRMNKDGSNNIIICDKDALQMIVTGNAIYFSEIDDYGYPCISKVNLDGTGYKVLAMDAAINMCLRGDRIYYINRSNNYRIYSIGTNGAIRYQLTDHNAKNLNIYGDYLIYQTKEYTDTYEKTLKIPNPPSTVIPVGKDEHALFIGLAAKLWEEYPYQRLGVDGKMHYYNINLRNPDMAYETPENVALHGDWYYYVAASNGLIYRRRIDDDNYLGTKVTQYEMDYLNNQYKIVGDWIYYNCDKGIVKVKTDGSGERLLNYKGNAHFDVEGNYIYYSYREGYDGPKKIYKMDTEGKENTLLAEMDADLIDVVGDYIYVHVKKDDQNYAIMRMSFDGTIIDEPLKSTFYNSLVLNNFSIYKDKFYYERSTAEGYSWVSRLYSCNLDGSDETLIMEMPWNMNKINIVEGYIYYTDERNKVNKIKLQE